MCEVLQLPRSTYYQSFHEVQSSYEIENEAILTRIKYLHAESKGRYGSPKIKYLLEQEDIFVSQKRVARLMKEAGISSVITKKYRPAPSSGKVEERENILEQKFEQRLIMKSGLQISPTFTN
jgi:putative transposase